MASKEIYLIMGMAAVTFGIRFVLFALADRITLPYIVKQSLKFIPPAVLTAITVPAVLMPEGSIDISLQNPYLIASLLATGVGLMTKNILITIIIGLVGFFLYQFLIF